MNFPRMPMVNNHHYLTTQLNTRVHPPPFPKISQPLILAFKKFSVDSFSLIFWQDQTRNKISTIILGTEQIFNKIGGGEFFDLFSDYQKFQMGG